MNIKTLTVALVTAMTATAATAGNIIGVVKDKATGEPLIGTVVSVKELKDMWATTGLDGSFTLNKMTANASTFRSKKTRRRSERWSSKDDRRTAPTEVHCCKRRTQQVCSTS